MEHSCTLSAEKLFKEYYTRLCHFAWQYLKDKERSEDVVQDAFANFLEHAHLVEQKSDASTRNYLYSCVRNFCLNIGRDSKIEHRYFTLSPSSDIENPKIMHQILRSEVMHEIYTIMASMPHGCQQVFKLSYLEGWSNQQVSEKLDISINTVKTQKQRGLKFVKERINPEFYGLLSLLFIHLP